MSDRSNDFRSKLKVCAGLAGRGTLAAAATLGLASKGYGASVIRPMGDHISKDARLQYDINGDGLYDVTFTTSALGVMMETQLHNCGASTFAGPLAVVTPPGGQLHPHAAGEMISAESLTDCAYDPSFFDFVVEDGSHGGFFEPAFPRYAGFAFWDVVTQFPDTLIHQAWAELVVTEPTTGEFELDVIAIGYETDSGVPVPAGGTVIGVSSQQTPLPVQIRPNSPNPFSDETQIEFSLPGPMRASVRIYDAAGRLVTTLERLHARKGWNSVKWDRTDSEGRRVPSGVYFGRLEAFGVTRSQKMVVVD